MTVETTLADEFGQDTFDRESFRDNERYLVPVAQLFAVLKCLKEKAGCDMLAELTAVDYLNYPDAQDRFGVVYVLTNTTTGARAYLKTHVNDPKPTVPSAFSLWKAADWMEREVFDMYGIYFQGHPDLRRILMPPEFTSYPLRKDYPLRGRGERHNFPSITRAES